MAKDAPLVSTSLATVPIESALFGTFLLLSAISIYAMIKADGRDTPRYGHAVNSVSSASLARTFKRPAFIVAIALLITVTGHWICTFMRLFLAILHSEDPLVFYATLSEPTEVIKTGFLMASLVLGDSMIIYRLWVVWDRRWAIVIFPLLSVTGLVVAGIGITYQFAIFPEGHDVFASEAGRWITSDTVLTLCTNVYCSVLIAWRIWNMSKGSSPFAVTGKVNVVTKSLIVFIESAALYAIWTILFLATYQSRTNMQFFVVDCWPVMAGISFMSINARIFLSMEANNKPKHGSGSIPSNPRYLAPYTAHSEAMVGHNNYPLNPIDPVAVTISHIVENDQDHPSTRKGELWGSDHD
ncbi:hypothetical protein E1B28_008197 [Marasmius oreades]|uniref:Uncharacterized protein n=1 Tax=Marasmius oreades TaxID=181124 RepID=A0A9P7RYH3_9AGAR|nr:uncharacterized protein E1B28_008197 [Marasmius oreades]KAG7091793.1 hypothetical protein E1B28_008197 [Marasmius oreades]